MGKLFTLEGVKEFIYVFCTQFQTKRQDRETFLDLIPGREFLCAFVERKKEAIRIVRLEK